MPGIPELDKTVLALTSVLVIAISTMFFRRNHLEVAGKHVYIGGGSQGLGLALAKLLLGKGAHVTIVGRSQIKLDAALGELEPLRAKNEQKIAAISADLSSASGSADALERASKPFQGRCPDIVLSCTGGAGGIMGFWVELTPEQLQKGVDQNYWAAAWTAHAAARKMAIQKVKGTICLTSSVLGFMAIPGYSAYTPAKHAIRGLAESLRVELLLYGISVHCYFPATIYSPGFEEEQKTKPQLTKTIEGPDEGLAPEQCAQRLVRGLQRGEFLITSDPIGSLFRNSMRGLAPSSHYIFDPLWSFAARIGIPVWRRLVEHQVKGHIQEHDREVVARLRQ